jgi:hypothetical protein
MHGEGEEDVFSFAATGHVIWAFGELLGRLVGVGLSGNIAVILASDCI